MHKIILIIIFILPLFLGCSSSKKIGTDDSISLRNPEEIYISGMSFFDNQEFLTAEEEFKSLQKLYPLSNESIQSEIMVGFIKYLQMDYDSSISKFQKFIQKYPSHNDLDYVYYMIAINNYEQITHFELDGQFNEIALESFNQVITRFPESEYTKDSLQKIILIKSNKAAKHMDIGRFYLKEKKYTAALNRFKIVVQEYSMTKFTPEALHRMVEAYYEMGMMQESIEMASVLGHNYPDTKWYRYSYNLIKKINNNNSILDKLTKIF